jgi:hypothetical protein
MMNSRKTSEQAIRFAERRRREDEAPRLRDEVPGLVSLQLDVKDGCGATWATRYTRRIVVGQAPALFIVPCSDPRCAGDGHDLTTGVMGALRRGERAFGGEEECAGSVGPLACPHVLQFSALAVYQASVGRASERLPAQDGCAGE